MKKIILLLIFGLFLSLIIFTGCGKDPNPGPEPDKFIVEVSPSSGLTVPINTEVIFDINTTASYMVIVTESEMGTTKMDTIQNPGNTTFSFLVSKLDLNHFAIWFYKGFEHKGIDRYVFGREPTNEEILCNLGFLRRFKLEFADAPGLPFYLAVLDLCLLDDTKRFYQLPSQTVVFDFGENLCGSEPSTATGNWHVEEDTLVIETTHFGFEIKQDTLIMTSQLKGALEIVRETFVSKY